MMHAISAASLFDGECFLPGRAVLIEDGRIADLALEADLPAGIALTHLPLGQILAPGYVDLQVNGGGDVLFNDAVDVTGLAVIAAAHRRLGTTGFLATLISPGRATMRAALDLLAGSELPGVIGLHLEGPFLAPARRGIHPGDAILDAGPDDFDLLCRPHAFPLLITLAPEQVPRGAVARLVEAGVIVFAGHSEADAATMARAFAEGLRGATHLFNAMSQITPREPGVVGAVLDSASAVAGIILDGHHVHPVNARVAFRMLGAARLFLVSDAMPSVGGTRTTFRVGATEVHLRNGRLVGPDGTLGGAHLCMAEAVRNAIAMLGAAPEEALRMATASPADSIGQANRGRLIPGAVADLLALDADWHVRRVWAGGIPA